MCGTRKEPEAESPSVVLYDLLATQASAADKRAAGTSRCLYFHTLPKPEFRLIHPCSFTAENPRGGSPKQDPRRVAPATEQLRLGHSP